MLKLTRQKTFQNRRIVLIVERYVYYIAYGDPMNFNQVINNIYKLFIVSILVDDI
jgi:hypothetical protein